MFIVGFKYNECYDKLIYIRILNINFKVRREIKACHGKIKGSAMLFLTEDESSDLDFIIPISVAVTYNNAGKPKLKISACKSFKDIGIEFIQKFEKNPLSDEAKSFVLTRLTDILAKSGFTPNKDYIFADTKEYILSDIKRLNKNLILPQTIIIPKSDYKKYDNITSFEPNEMQLKYDYFPYFAISEDKKIFSVAAVNGTPKNGTAEISIDTASLYRKKGFASSAVTKAAEYLLLHGYRVSYVTFSDNPQSVGLAEKCGFVLKSVCFDGVCTRV